MSLVTVVKLDFGTSTPSPPTATHSYPFVNRDLGKKILVPLADSPSPPKKNNLLSRLHYSGRHKALARISNPLLSAAYKLGEQQAQRKVNKSMQVGETANRLFAIQRVQSPTAPAVLFERDYVPLEPLGQGEFSTVWKVRDKKDHQLYAVKRNKPFIGEKDR